MPGGALGSDSDSDFWRALRQGDRGTVSIPNEQAGVLIQSEGDNWRAIRNGPLSTYGVWGLLGIDRPSGAVLRDPGADAHRVTAAAAT